LKIAAGKSIILKEAQVFFERFVRGVSPEVLRNTKKKLMILNSVSSLAELRIPPGNRLEALRGGRMGLYSIRVNDKWRICFKFLSGNSYDVELTDYH
jgi:proteic killer suppression protein